MSVIRNVPIIVLIFCAYPLASTSTTDLDQLDWAFTNDTNSNRSSDQRADVPSILNQVKLVLDFISMLNTSNAIDLGDVSKYLPNYSYTDTNGSQFVDVISMLNQANTLLQRFPTHNVSSFISKFAKLLRTFDINNIKGNGSISNCTNDMGTLVVGLMSQKSWAIQFLDATGKPGPSVTQGRLNFVGNLDQCTSATATTQLGTGTEVKASSSSGKKGEESKEGMVVELFHGGYFQIGLKSPSIRAAVIQIGVCLPDSCSEQEVKLIANGIINGTNISLSVESVHHITNETEITSATIVAIVVLCVIGAMIILGTLFDLLFIEFVSWYATVVKSHKESSPVDLIKNSATNHSEDPIATPGVNGAESVTTTQPGTLHNKEHPENTVTKVLLAFSVYSNAKKILNASQPAGSLKAIHGIRFLSISWVVLGHTYSFAMNYFTNVTESSELLKRWSFDVIANGHYSVDTFFTLSGLLTSYLTIGELLKKGVRLNWPMFYFHRFWRLTPPYMLCMLFYVGFQQYFIQGSLRNYEQPVDKTSCEKNWWTNLLYINNVVHNRDMCFGHSWYLANDMQFFIVSPLMMIPFYFHRIAGLCSCLFFLLASWITTGVLSTINEWPATPWNMKNMLQGEGVPDGWQYDYYTMPWCRIGPFIVGILAGYVLAIHKGKSLRMKWWIVVLGWITSSVSALLIIFGIRGDLTGENVSSVGAAALYNSVARSVWGACVSWVIIACVSGYGGPVNTFLSWSPFVVLGRLSYMLYLTHVPVMFMFYQNLEQLFYLNDSTMIIYFCGLLLACNLLAFVSMLVLESPMVGLEKAILRRENKK